jgi:hypothetical protein
MRESEATPAYPEGEPLAALLEELGHDIVSFTEGRDDARLANAASAVAEYSPEERLTFIYKEEGSDKIGPEFVILDQIALGAESLKTLTFRWPEYYPSDQRTWGLTIIDSSLPERERRRNIPGGALKDPELKVIGELLNKARTVVDRRG